MRPFCPISDWVPPQQAHHAWLQYGALALLLTTIGYQFAYDDIAAAVQNLQQSSTAWSRVSLREITTDKVTHVTAQPDLPEDFDWLAYRFYNPQLRIPTKEAALKHYVKTGRQQGNLYKWIPLYLSYNATFGLCNQLFSHLGMLAIATSMNATLIPSVAYSRRNFTHEGSVYREEPLQSLLNVEEMTEYFADRGLPIVKDPDVSQCAVVSVHDYYKKKTRFPMVRAIQQVATYISKAVQPTLKQRPDASVCVHVDWGNPFRGIFPVFHRGIFFAPEILSKVDEVLDALTASGHVPFLGVHLRIEDDWTKFFKKEAPERTQDLTALYIEAMERANFTDTSPVYVASGIYEYQSKEEIAKVEKRLHSSRVCGSMLHRERVLPPSAFEGMHSEQLALVDLLVLTHAKVVIGDAYSSFSSFVREWRALHGVPKSTFVPAIHDGAGVYAEIFTFTPPSPIVA